MAVMTKGYNSLQGYRDVLRGDVLDGERSGGCVREPKDSYLASKVMTEIGLASVFV